MYSVRIYETVVHTVEVDAENDEAAIRQAYSVWADGIEGTFCTESLGTDNVEVEVLREEEE